MIHEGNRPFIIHYLAFEPYSSPISGLILPPLSTKVWRLFVSGVKKGKKGRFVSGKEGSGGLSTGKGK